MSEYYPIINKYIFWENFVSWTSYKTPRMLCQRFDRTIAKSLLYPITVMWSGEISTEARIIASFQWTRKEMSRASRTRRNIWSFFYNPTHVDYDCPCVIYLRRYEPDWVWLRSIMFGCFDWFAYRTNNKIDVRFCSIADPIERWVWLNFGSSLIDKIRRACS